jgi:hypothetical protein
MMYWTSNLKTAEDKARFESSLIGSKVVLDRLLEILEIEETELERTEVTPDFYDTPGWAAKQAHNNGQRSVYRKIKQLLRPKEKNELTR